MIDINKFESEFTAQQNRIQEHINAIHAADEQIAFLQKEKSDRAAAEYAQQWGMPQEAEKPKSIQELYKAAQNPATWNKLMADSKVELEQQKGVKYSPSEN